MSATASVQSPDLRALLDGVKEEIFFSFNCHQLGVITAFNSTLQTVSVALAVQRVFADGARSYPVLVDVPAFVYSGGGGIITMPIAAGDTCLVLFNDRDIDKWWSTGATVPPNSRRAHDLSDGLALIGFRSKANKISGYATDAIEAKHGGGRVRVTSEVSATAAGGAQMVLAEKVRLENESGSLLSVLTSICAALTALNSVKSGGDASAAISAAQSNVDDLLQ